MTKLIYPRDKALTIITFILGMLIWAASAGAVVKASGSRGIGALVSTVLMTADLSFLVYIFARTQAKCSGTICRTGWGSRKRPSDWA